MHQKEAQHESRNEPPPEKCQPFRALRCPKCNIKLKIALKKATKAHLKRMIARAVTEEEAKRVLFKCPGACREGHWMLLNEALTFLKGC